MFDRQHLVVDLILDHFRALSDQFQALVVEDSSLHQHNLEFIGESGLDAKRHVIAYEWQVS